jgi:hypothetical protein
MVFNISRYAPSDRRLDPTGRNGCWLTLCYVPSKLSVIVKE